MSPRIKDGPLGYPVVKAVESIGLLAEEVRLVVDESRCEWALLFENNHMVRTTSIGFDKSGSSCYKIDGDEFLWCVMDPTDLHSVSGLISWIAELAEKKVNWKPPVGLDC